MPRVPEWMLRPCVLLMVLALAGCERRERDAVLAKGGDGEFRLSLPAEPRTLNPNLGPDEPAQIIGNNLFSRLIALSADGRLLPDLAEAWDESADGLTYTFQLRRGVRWHDGRPFGAEDVRATFERIVESGNQEIASRIAGVEVVGEHTVAIRLRAPWAAFIANLAWFGAAILPAHHYGGGAWGEEPIDKVPVGTGPFRFKAWERGSRVLLEKNDDYYGPGPYVDEVTFLFARSSQAAFEMMLAGDTHLLIGRPPSARLAEAEARPDLQVLTQPTESRVYLALNMRRPPFDRLEARRAVNLALDRAGVVHRALNGLGAPAVGFYTPTIAWAYNRAAQVPAPDPAEAARLVRLGRAGDRPLRLVYPGPGFLDALPDEIGRQLRAAGFRIVLEPIPLGGFYEQIYRQHDFDLAIVLGSQGPDPDALAVRFGSAGAFQVMGYANEEVDAALDRARRISDIRERARLYHRVQEILAEDLPVAPVAEGVRVTVARRGLRGIPHEDARGLVGDYVFSLVRLPRP